uniref:NADH-ubiquinone oxidoreductase chain 5 n=1 Tax=Ochetellus glaber TaxID=255795 RepID=A0A6B9BJP8_9HYME|nr:NADH dehydrogenase subunit 5 [Ochetellus glaber]QGW36337.1 NADH dehydrogenase subunit 5 [Ochetellus glaber]
MINLVIYSIFMFMFSMFFFFLSMWMFSFDYLVMMEWLVMSYSSVNLELFMMLDWISFMFMSLVLLISSMIFLYSKIYMMNDLNINRFMLLVLMFILSMLIMIISPNIFSILFGWDGLGLVSYCLVIYYQNYSSYNSGMVTVLCNRIGDIGLLMSIGVMIMYGSWNIFMLNNSIILLFLLLAAMTKSAQLPFSSWLPMAMAAPTPVSALVHSSTLVTAGVYLMIRFNDLLMLSGMNKFLLYVSILTMFMSGLMANVEFDLKKIIALSTLSQLGMMMMILSLGYSYISFYHLLSHAVFKSLLFMCAGIMIHLMNNNQDIRNYGSLNELIPFTMMSFYISKLSLCGFPFMSGYYSKDLIMEMIFMNQMNFIELMMILLSLSFTVMYSFRLFYYMFFGEMKFYSYMYVKENFTMNLSMMMLMIFSIMVGSMLNWLFFFDLYIPILCFYMKILTLLLCLFGIILGKFFISFDMISLYLYLYFFSSMWFLNYLIMVIYKPMMIMSKNFSYMDKTWLEYSNRMLMINLVMKYSKFNYNYKIFMFMKLIMFFVFIIYLWL